MEWKKEQYIVEPITVNYKILDPRAKTPAYATGGAAAADLCAVLDEPLTLQPMQRALVPTGLAIELPGAHTVALVYARSGLSIKHGLCMANGVGVIDSDYRGELKVPMINLGTEAYTIQPGERVAQLCIAPVYTAAFVPSDVLGDTARGEGGFGSTGK
jgi:dUTP pyrophosphatase